MDFTSKAIAELQLTSQSKDDRQYDNNDYELRYRLVQALTNKPETSTIALLGFLARQAYLCRLSELQPFVAMRFADVIEEEIEDEIYCARDECRKRKDYFYTTENGHRVYLGDDFINDVAYYLREYLFARLGRWSDRMDPKKIEKSFYFFERLAAELKKTGRFTYYDEEDCYRLDVVRNKRSH